MKFKDKVKENINVILGLEIRDRVSPFIKRCNHSGLCATDGSCCGGYMGHRYINIEGKEYCLIFCQEDIICSGNRYKMENKK